MPASDTSRLDDRLAAETEAYLDTVAECVDCVPTVVEQYADGGDYRDAVARIRELESECDRTNRRISALVAGADVDDLGIRLSRVHIHAGQTIELYHRVDDVANAAEQFAEELAATAPDPRSEQLRRLGEMADRTVDVAPAFASVVTAFVDVLCQPEDGACVAGDVAEIRAAESDCDRLRNQVVAAAFDDGGARSAVAYRELAHHLGALTDAMEDATDQMIRVAGNDLPVDLEPGTDQRA